MDKIYSNILNTGMLMEQIWDLAWRYCESHCGSMHSQENLVSISTRNIVHRWAHCGFWQNWRIVAWIAGVWHQHWIRSVLDLWLAQASDLVMVSYSILLFTEVYGWFLLFWYYLFQFHYLGLDCGCYHKLLPIYPCNDVHVAHNSFDFKLCPMDHT